jgi:hypothetical protein
MQGDSFSELIGGQRVCHQGCQMVYFQTKYPNLGKFWRALDWKILIYFMAIANIWLTFGIFYDHFLHFLFIWYIFPILVSRAKKNLAALCAIWNVWLIVSPSIGTAKNMEPILCTIASYYASAVKIYNATCSLEPILRLLNLQIQQHYCSRVERFFKIEENICVFKTH